MTTLPDVTTNEQDQRSDADLLTAHVEGDDRAFAALIIRHRDRLWAVALRTMSDPEEAADALQDAMLSAHRGAAGFRGDAQVTTWLHRVVINACLDRLRRNKTRATIPLPEHDSAHPVERADPLGQRELAWEIEQALATLPDDQRAALVLVDVEGYSVEEAAAHAELPHGHREEPLRARTSQAGPTFGPFTEPGRLLGRPIDVYTNTERSADAWR